MPKQETIKRIVEKVNSFIDVPFMTEGQEAIPIEIVVGKVFSSFRKNSSHSWRTLKTGWTPKRSIDTPLCSPHF